MEDDSYDKCQQRKMLWKVVLSVIISLLGVYILLFGSKTTVNMSIGASALIISIGIGIMLYRDFLLSGDDKPPEAESSAVAPLPAK